MKFEVLARYTGWGQVAGWYVCDSTTKTALMNRDQKIVMFKSEELALAWVDGYKFGYTTGKAEGSEWHEEESEREAIALAAWERLMESDWWLENSQTYGGDETE